MALLTGATGFLGANLLHDLLIRTSLEVRCLLRSAKICDASPRLQRALESQGLWQEEFAGRIQVVVGDLSKPALGVSDAEFEALRTEVDVIYHNGAHTNLIFPYRALQPTNVMGTRELLRLADGAPVKEFHHVSSISIFGEPPIGASAPIREDLRAPRPQRHSSGYAESKWAAEGLVCDAAEGGLAVSIYRPGRITGHSRTGACSEEDMFSLLLRSCVQLGVAPDFDGWVQLTPVDFVSRAIVQLSLNSSSRGKAFHLVKPDVVSWEEVVEILRTVGAVERILNYGDWLNVVKQQVRECPEDGAVHALLSNVRPPFSGPRRHVSDDNVVFGLADVPDVWETVSPALLLQRQVEFLVRPRSLQRPAIKRQSGPAST